MKIKSEKGYLILAVNNGQDDYIHCARMLARSLRFCNSKWPICLVSDQIYDYQEFDHHVTLPFGDRSGKDKWKLHNDWQIFYCSPYRQTIKLEADMIVPYNIDHWFDVCVSKDLVVTVGARDHTNELTTERFYRKIFDVNDLPDVYNAITYWRRSDLAQKFFDNVREIFENWFQVMSVLKYGNSQPLNTDLAYALAMKLLGEDRFVLPGTVPGLIHMKPRILSIQGEDWRKEMIWEIAPGSVRINTVQQLWPMHYNIKEFSKTLEKIYGQY